MFIDATIQRAKIPATKANTVPATPLHVLTTPDDFVEVLVGGEVVVSLALVSAVPVVVVPEIAVAEADAVGVVPVVPVSVVLADVVPVAVPVAAVEPVPFAVAEAPPVSDPVRVNTPTMVVVGAAVGERVVPFWTHRVA